MKPSQRIAKIYEEYTDEISSAPTLASMNKLEFMQIHKAIAELARIADELHEEEAGANVDYATDTKESWVQEYKDRWCHEGVVMNDDEMIDFIRRTRAEAISEHNEKVRREIEKVDTCESSIYKICALPILNQ